MRIYTTKAESENAGVLYQETQKGHTEEFLHEKKAILYIISLKAAGSGSLRTENLRPKPEM